MHDTITTIEFDPDTECFTVFVNVKPADHSLRYWSLPPSELMRHWIDAAIREFGARRDGNRTELSGPIGGWRFVYYARKA
jgi:hypothetical protein